MTDSGDQPHAASLEVGWRSFVDRSTDQGKTWARSPYLPRSIPVFVCVWYDVYISRSRYLTVNDSHVLKGKLPSTDGAEGEVVSHLSLSLSLSVLSL